MSKRFFLCCLLALVLTRAVHAQGLDHAAPPIPPFVAAMPDNSTWTINVTNASTSAKLPPGARVVNQFINTKSGQNRELTSFWTDGTKSYLWFWDGFRLQQNPSPVEVLVTRVPGGHDIQNADFPDLNWLQTTNYVGREDYGGRDCYHFKARVEIDIVHTTFDYSAYIDSKTKRPVAWNLGPNHFELTSFAMRKADDPLILPEAFGDQLRAYRLAAREVNPYQKK